MNAIIRAVDRLNQFIGLSVSHLYLICVAITIYEVAMRYLFDSPTQWAFEVVMVVCASAWVLCFTRECAHQIHEDPGHSLVKHNTRSLPDSG